MKYEEVIKENENNKDRINELNSNIQKKEEKIEELNNK